jgi:hypothetical protein
VATVPNKDGQDQFPPDVHVYTPAEMRSSKVGATLKLPAGAGTSGKPPVPAP